MYKVLVDFTDKETKEIYLKGEIYPKTGKVSKKRATELLGADNLRKTPLISEVVKKNDGKDK